MEKVTRRCFSVTYEMSEPSFQAGSETGVIEDHFL